MKYLFPLLFLFVATVGRSVSPAQAQPYVYHFDFRMGDALTLENVYKDVSAAGVESPREWTTEVIHFTVYDPVGTQTFTKNSTDDPSIVVLTDGFYSIDIDEGDTDLTSLDADSTYWYEIDEVDTDGRRHTRVMGQMYTISQGGFPVAGVTSGVGILLGTGGVNITLETTGASGYTVVMDEASGLTQRSKVNFTGSGVTCADDAANFRTNCTITSGGGSGTMTTVKDTGVQVGGADQVTLDFGNGLDVSESPDTEANISVNVGELEAGLEAVMDLQDMQGAVTDGQLPAEVPLTDEANTFSAIQTFSDSLIAPVGIRAAVTGTDPVISFSDGVVNVSRGALQVGGVAVSTGAHTTDTDCGSDTACTFTDDTWNGTAIGAQYGGTGQNFSASTGIIRANSGTFSADAGVGHLASSTSASLAGVLSDETGSGAAVFGTSPAIATPTLTLQDGNGAAPTTDGQFKFDRTTERLQVGDGSSTNEFYSGAHTSFSTLDSDYGAETITSDFDFGGGTLQVPNSTTLPGTCEVGDIYMDTDAASGQRIYACESANTWKLQGDGGASATEVRSFIWPAGAMVADETNCAAPATNTIGTNGPAYTVICTDNDGSTIYGDFVMPDSWDGSTITFELTVIQDAADTANLNGDISAQCRGDGETSGGFGTEVALDIATLTGSDGVDTGTSGAVTPSGTCAGGDWLQWRWQMDATGTTTAVATLNIMAMKVEYTSTIGD